MPDFPSAALIVFARRPCLGAVKTRLATTLGDEAALHIYRRLLEHTRREAAGVDCDRFLFLTGDGEELLWDGFTVLEQSSGHLGIRMSAAFRALFGKGYSRVLVIGSDCPALTYFAIEAAFTALHFHDAVVGPATDGGYYLLGTGGFFPELFTDMVWSTDTVLQETVERLKAHHRTHILLSPLTDVDTAADLPEGWMP